MNLRNPTC